MRIKDNQKQKAERLPKMMTKNLISSQRSKLPKKRIKSRNKLYKNKNRKKGKNWQKLRSKKVLHLRLNKMKKKEKQKIEETEKDSVETNKMTRNLEVNLKMIKQMKKGKNKRKKKMT